MAGAAAAPCEAKPVNTTWFDTAFSTTLIILYGSLAVAALMGTITLFLFLTGFIAGPCG